MERADIVINKLEKKIHSSVDKEKKVKQRKVGLMLSVCSLDVADASRRLGTTLMKRFSVSASGRHVKTVMRLSTRISR